LLRILRTSGTLYNVLQSGAKGIVVSLQKSFSNGFWIPGAGVTAIFNSAVQEVLNRCKITVVDSMRANSSRVPLSDVSSRTAMNIASG
jgi:hypothetical protein